MLIYFSLLASLLPFIFNKKNDLIIFPLIFIGIIICMGYMTGSDWRLYESYYINDAFPNYETSFILLTELAQRLKIDFWIYLITIKIAVYIILLRTLRKYNINVALFLFIYLSEMGLYLFVDNPLRNFIAFGIFLFALEPLFKRNFIRYFLIIFLASTFHITALIAIPIYFISNMRFNSTAVLGVFIALLSLSYFGDQILTLISNILSAFGNVNARYSSYSDEYYLSSNINFGLIHRLFFLFLILHFYPNFRNNQITRIIFNLALLSIILYPISSYIVILKRFDIYLSLFPLWSTLLILESLEKNKLLLIGILLLYSIGRMYLLVTSDYRYIPYSNYLVYFFAGEQLPYGLRYMFNFYFSPYE